VQICTSRTFAAQRDCLLRTMWVACFRCISCARGYKTENGVGGGEGGDSLAPPTLQNREAFSEPDPALCAHYHLRSSVVV
jgi:hypothetical protein